MTKIEINGVQTEAEPGSTIIEVADRLAIPIPRFCYHPKLSVAANCRMCLVHVDKSPKPLPACATPITEGMKIWTASPQAIAAQKSVMEFLLINHPLDCPICDQGGECELQDISMEYGSDVSRYTEAKRVVLDQNLGPLVATDMTRCIQCTRCVRFGEEVSGERELGATGRSEHIERGTFIQQNVNSELSGNVIDLCPVGALTSKPFRFKARAWELKQYPGIAVHDCLGSSTYLHVANNIVMRVVPKMAEDLNEVWLSDRDRFSYEALTHDDRLRKPMISKNGTWNVIPWIEALNYVVAGLKLCLETYGADQLGVLCSPNASIEELYLLNNLARNFGTNNIDHRLRQLDFNNQNQAPLYPNFGIKFKDLEMQDVVLLVGSQIHKEQPIAGLKLRKMTIKGGKACVINPVDFKFNFAVTAKSISASADLVIALAGVAKELLNLVPAQAENSKFSALLVNITPTDADKLIAATLLSGTRRHVVLGQLALMHPQASQLCLLADVIAKIIGGSFGTLSDGANAAGAWLAGCVPHRITGGGHSIKTGKNALEMLQTPLKCYILYAIEPELDSIVGEQALSTLKQADFVVVFSAYQSKTLLDIADIIIPIAAFAETDGTTVNIDGKWQSRTAVVPPFGDSRPGWKILRVLGNLAGFAKFEQESSHELLQELQKLIVMPAQLPNWRWNLSSEVLITGTKGLVRIAPVGLYAADSTVRRAKALQQSKDAIATPTMQINSKTAAKLNLKSGAMVKVSSNTGVVNISTELNEQLADQTIMINQAHSHTASLGAADGSVEISLC